MEDYRKSEQSESLTPKRPVRKVSSSARWLAAGLVVAIAMSLALGYALYRMQEKFDASVQDFNDQFAELQDTLPLFAERIDQHQNQLGTIASEWQAMQGRLGVTEQELEQAKVLANNLREEQNRAAEALSRQIVTKAEATDLEELKNEATGRFEKVDAQLAGVEEDLSHNLGELEKTWAELADLGVKVTEQGDLIATSMEGIKALERRGEREYFQFTTGLYRQLHFGDIGLELRDTNRKKNRAKLLLAFDDKRIVRDRVATNQPLTFYVGRDRVPYEVVINEVEKGKISGYVSVPVGATTSKTLARLN